MSLSCTISEILSITFQNLKRSREAEHTHFTLACTSTRRLLLAPAALGGARSIRYTTRLELATVNPRTLAGCRFSTAYFVEIGNFAPFSEFLHTKGGNFPDAFYTFTSTYDPYEPWKVSWKSVCTFFKNPEDRNTNGQTDRRGSFVYIDKQKKSIKILCTILSRAIKPKNNEWIFHSDSRRVPSTRHITGPSMTVNICTVNEAIRIDKTFPESTIIYIHWNICCTSIIASTHLDCFW